MAKPEPLDLVSWEKEVHSKAKKLAKEIEEGFRIKYDAFFVEIPGPQKFKELKVKDWEVARLYGILHAIREVRKKIKSACEFWLRYKDNPKQFVEDYPEYEEEVKKFVFLEDLSSTFWYDWSAFDYEEYHKWLFKLAFKDVMEKDKK